MNTQKAIAIVVAVVVVVGAVLYFGFGFGKGSKPVVSTSPTASTTAATVNGVAITRAAFDAQLASRVATYRSQGIDVTDPTKLAQINAQLLDDLINNEVVSQEVAKVGITVSPSDVEKQYQALLTSAGGADGLKTQLTAANITDAQLRTNISTQLAIQSYLLANIATSSITVSDAEVKAFYDTNTKGVKDPPSLKTVTAQIKQQLTTNKQQELINVFVASLRAKADIKTY